MRPSWLCTACCSGVVRGSTRARVRVRLSLVPPGVDRIGDPLLAGAAKVIDQQVAGQGGDPGRKAALGGVEAAQVGVELDEDVLSQIFRVMGKR